MGMHPQELAVHADGSSEFVNELPTGTLLGGGRYTCQDFLGSDGFAITYLATRKDNLTFVIKECFPAAFCRREGLAVSPRSEGHRDEVASMVRLFAQEARHLFKIGHENIIGVREVFAENETSYVVLEFVNGRDLLELSQDEGTPPTPDHFRELLEKILDAIGAVHRYGLLHRDVSPSNIIVRDDGEPILIDFGSAREQATKSSRILSVLRSLRDGYSPHEFYISGSHQGPSCDLYSLAASFYHVITGDLPPGSQQRLAARASGRTDPYVPLEEMATGFDPHFCAALDKAMSIMPEDRFASAEAWIKALEPEVIEVPPAAVEVEPDIQDEIVGEDGARVEAPESAEGLSRIETTVEIARPRRPERQFSELATDVDDVTDVPAATRARSSLALILRGTALVALTTVGVTALFEMMLADEPIIALIESPAPSMAPSETDFDFDRPVSIAAFVPAVPVSQPTLGSSVLLMQEHGLTASILAAPQAPKATKGETIISVSDVPADSTPTLADELLVATPVQSVVDAPAKTEAPAAAAAFAMFGVPSIGEVVEVVEVSETADVPTEFEEAASVAFSESLALLLPEVAQIGDRPSISQGITTKQDPLSSRTAAESANGDVMTSISTPIMPFALHATDPGLVVSVTEAAPDWIRVGDRIESLNGELVITWDGNPASLAVEAEANAAAFDLEIGLVTRSDLVPELRTLSAPLVHETKLANGFSFESRRENDRWITTVTKAPESSGFKVGDVIAGSVRKSERIESPADLSRVVAGELAQGRTNMAFAVERDGYVWVKTLSFSEPTTAQSLPSQQEERKS